MIVHRPVRLFLTSHVEKNFGTKGSISDEEWTVIKKILKEKEIESVIEFGAGFSTKRFDAVGCEVTSLETDFAWAEVIRRKVPRAKVFIWDNWDLPSDLNGKKFDLAFVDGEQPRDRQVFFGKQLSDYLLLHDINKKAQKEIMTEQLAKWHGWKATYLDRLGFFERNSENIQ